MIKKMKMKHFNLKNMMSIINFILLISVIVLLVSPIVKNEQTKDDLISAIGDLPGDELLYYDVYVAGEIATYDQITAMIISGSDWRDAEGRPLSIDFRRVKREGICEDLVQEALASCDE